jgi:hypothetical protein
MRRRHGNRARLGGALLAALGALALLGALPGLAAAKDRNHDRIPDRWERRHHLSLTVNQDRRDQDRDGLDDMGEFKAGDNPRDKDTDNDGVDDREENAGTITAYDAETGKLTIALFGGETVSGLVTEDTRIRCGRDCDRMGDQGDDSGNDESGATTSSRDEDNSGRGSHDSGSQSGPPGQGEDENDDPPGHDGTPPGASEGPGRGDENSADCGPEALVVGAEVDEAELELQHGTATFEEVDLAP